MARSHRSPTTTTLSRRNFLISGTFLAGAFVTAPILSANGKTPAPAQAAVDAGHLDALIHKAISTHAAPGIALAVWQNGRTIYSQTAGIANLETGAKVLGSSVFRIGSLSKQFSGALVMMLASQGKLSLSDPASKHLPFLDGHEPFTILELLNHTAGVNDGDYDTKGVDPRSQIEQAKRISEQKPFFDFPPGTAWLYSNANYILIGAIVEKVTGKSLSDAAASMLFEPLHLPSTAFDAPSEVVEGRVSGYAPTDVPERPFENAEYLDVRFAGAAGGMRSTAADLCRWHHALFQGDALPAAWREKMLEPGRLRNGALAGSNRFSANDKMMGDTQYGVGLMLDRSTKDGSLIAGHHGGINGFAAYLASHPSSGLGYAVLCNADTHPGLPLRDIRREVFRDVLRPIPT